jgi:N-acetylmuramoyl-L-alanine amidase
MERITKIEFIIVHCSGAPIKMLSDARSIDFFHKKLGFDAIGYHYVIKRDGLVETGRDEQMVGAHALGMNRKSLSICLIGGVNSRGEPENNFTKKQFLTLRRLIQKLKQKYHDAEVLGHHDIPGVTKECPCFNVKKWWQDQKKPVRAFP